MIGVGVMALTLPGMRPRLSLRGNPSCFVRLDALALGLGVTTVATGLAVSATIGAMYFAAGGSGPWYGSHPAPGGSAASLVSAALLGAMITRGARFMRRVRQARGVARVEGWLGRHHDCGDHDLVYVPTPAPVAYSVHGARPQVVISDDLAALLGTDGLSFVIDHERAHLRRRHQRYLLLAALVDALAGHVASVARSTLALRLAVERAADEEAAGADARRRRRFAASLRLLAATPSLPGADPESLRYRAHHLRSAPAGPAVHREVVAAIGIVVLGAILTATMGHVRGDLPALIAAVR